MRTIRVLVVDDSAFARKVVREMLADSPFIEVVGSARDGAEALELTAALQPDLVTCDLVMPTFSGLWFVREQMTRRPLPILILSAAAEDAAEVIEALSAGAVDVVQKPTALASESLRSIRSRLVERVRSAALAQVTRPSAPLPATCAPALPSPGGGIQMVVIGISTGGPQALRRLLPRLPADFPVPLAIVLHMPVGYTRPFAEKLNELCALEVKEAADGDVLRPGRVLLAQAGRHLSLRRTAAGEVVAELSLQPLTKIHRPSADVLFRSASEAFGARVLAVVMTGMGDDGKEGSAWIKAHGGAVITESENSCVIYGMPRSVVEAGLSDAAIALDDLAGAITARL